MNINKLYIIKINKNEIMKRLMKFASILGIIALVLSATLITPNFAQAGQLASIQVLLKATDSETGNNVVLVNTQVPYTFVKFDPATTLDVDDGNNDGIRIDFDSFQDTVEAADITVTQNAESLAKTVSDADNGGLIDIVLTGDATANKDGAVTVKITADATDFLTPVANGSYLVEISTYDLGTDDAFGGVDAAADTLKDSGAALVIIGDAGEYDVTITGTVEPTLTLTLSSQSCGLGTLTSSIISTCNYTTTVATNATGGYTSYIRATDGLLSGANEINTGTTVDEGTEAYGVATNGANNVDIQEGITCPASGGTTAVTTTALIDNTDMSLATATAPVSSAATIVCHAASITGTTQAGNYTQTVTITAVGNF